MKLKFDTRIITAALPLALELVAITLLFAYLGYSLGGLVSKLMSAVGMFIGAMLGLGLLIYRITKKY